MSLSDRLLLANGALGFYPTATPGRRTAREGAEVEWRAAIAAITDMLAALATLNEAALNETNPIPLTPGTRMSNTNALEIHGANIDGADVNGADIDTLETAPPSGAPASGNPSERKSEERRSDPLLGTVLSGPLPVITTTSLSDRISPWIVTPQPLAEALNGRRSLLPGATTSSPRPCPLHALPLPVNHPLLAERFCLVVTAQFRLVVVLGQPGGGPWQCQYSFDPGVVQQIWHQVQGAIAPQATSALTTLQTQLEQYAPAPPAYSWMMQFSQRLLTYLPHRQPPPAPKTDTLPIAHWYPPRSAPTDRGPEPGTPPWDQDNTLAPGADAELLQAMTHEIRTPLTTIRTLTRSLLLRQDISAPVTQRLQRIDQECTQQIDRFNLIFRAAELTTLSQEDLSQEGNSEAGRPSLSPRHRHQSFFAPISLSQIFQAAIPQWQQQAHRRNLQLSVNLPSRLPTVFSDPTLLHQVLTGVVEWLTQGLPAQSQIQMRVTLAGPQLKLQFESQPGDIPAAPNQRPAPRSLGQLLTVAPDTGGVSLNLEVTKTLFQALGGKLIVRQRPHQGDVLTVYLPLETREV